MRFYFTFGYGQYGGAYRNKYVEVEATGAGEARQKMVEAFGTVWAFQYNEKEFIPQIEQFGLSLLETI